MASCVYAISVGMGHTAGGHGTSPRELHIDTDLQFDCRGFIKYHEVAQGPSNMTCVSRGEVVDRDAANGSTDESAEEESNMRDEESPIEAEDDSGYGQTGDDNGFVSMQAGSAGAMLVTSLVVVALGGLLN
ncbi:hypothetical protein BJX65DRAFT_309302 [Aspergillus insuetus]